MWYHLFLLVVSSLISSMLAPKPNIPKPARLSDFTVPTAKQDRPIPVVFGTVWVTGPNVVWFGDLSSQGIKGGGKK